MSKDTKFYLDVIKSEECQCGKSKRIGTAFCYLCYSNLPKDMKDDLWKKIGNGFEEAYEEAHKELNS